MTQLLADIEAFLASHTNLSPTRFGDEALGDRHFVRQIRGGRRVWPETECKVRAFMSAYAANDGETDHAAVATMSPCEPSPGNEIYVSGALA